VGRHVVTIKITLIVKFEVFYLSRYIFKNGAKAYFILPIKITLLVKFVVFNLST